MNDAVVSNASVCLLTARVQTRYQEWKLGTIEKLLDLLSDFSDEPDEQQDQEQDDGEEFSVKRYVSIATVFNMRLNSSH